MKTWRDLRFVVIGTGRCGTGYVSQLLQHCGIPTGHEAVFNPFRDGYVALPDDEIVGECSYMALPYLEPYGFPDTVVVHLVRDPLAVIRSMVGIKYPVADTEYDTFARNHLPRIAALRHRPLTSAIFWYMNWNLRCEKVASYRVRVEELTTLERVRDLLEVLRVDVTDEQVLDALKNTPTDYNSRPRADVAWDDILLDPFGRDVVHMADRYGYQH